MKTAVVAIACLSAVACSANVGTPAPDQGASPEPSAQGSVMGGSVSGLRGKGLILQDNMGDVLPLSLDGAFAFPTAIPAGSAYTVSILQQPSIPTQTCSVGQGGSAAAGGGVAVTCQTSSFKVRGTVSGIAGTAVLTNNGGDTVTVKSNGSFTFPTAVPSGDAYIVSVLQQPAGPDQTCTVEHGQGQVGGGDVSNVSIHCATDLFHVQVVADGADGAALILQNNGNDNLPIPGDGTYEFVAPLADGSSYDVTVLSQAVNVQCTPELAGQINGQDAVIHIGCRLIAGP